MIEHPEILHMRAKKEPEDFIDLDLHHKIARAEYRCGIANGIFIGVSLAIIAIIFILGVPVL